MCTPSPETDGTTDARKGRYVFSETGKKFWDGHTEIDPSQFHWGAFHAAVARAYRVAAWDPLCAAIRARGAVRWRITQIMLTAMSLIKQGYALSCRMLWAHHCQ